MLHNNYSLASSELKGHAAKKWWSQCWRGGSSSDAGKEKASQLQIIDEETARRCWERFAARPRSRDK
ncbi:Hypothetical protein BN69_0085 [Methylocystis sp. SC2]|nr:Hypothetical protein BN69_0085 [Methylocystis sp. SC2]